MRTTYLALMRLYPPEHRAIFGDEMASVFESVSRDVRSRGWSSYTVFLFAEFGGLLRGAAEARGGVWRGGNKPPIFPFLAGAILTALFMRVLIFSHLPYRISQPRAFTQNEALELIAMATFSVVLIAACSVAFAINLRILSKQREQSARKRLA